MLILLSGIVVGFALGLTGGGGSIFAVPLLIYLLHVDVHTAVGVSLTAVGASSAFGVMTRLRSGEIDYRVGTVFAVTGMAGAPVGTWIGSKLDPTVVVASFAVLMLFVGVRMWLKSEESLNSESGPKKAGRAHEAWIRLGLIGFLVGVTTGIFGVGGGFIIVPALVLFGGVTVHRAVSTSLLVITLICLSGVISFHARGEPMPLKLTLIFVVGGCIGMVSGGKLRSRLTGQAMRRVFAAAMWFIALFILTKTFIESRSPEEAGNTEHASAEVIQLRFPWGYS